MSHTSRTSPTSRSVRNMGMTTNPLSSYRCSRKHQAFWWSRTPSARQHVTTPACQHKQANISLRYVARVRPTVPPAHRCPQAPLRADCTRVRFMLCPWYQAVPAFAVCACTFPSNDQMVSSRSYQIFHMCPTSGPHDHTVSFRPRAKCVCVRSVRGTPLLCGLTTFGMLVGFPASM